MSGPAVKRQSSASIQVPPNRVFPPFKHTLRDIESALHLGPQPRNSSFDVLNRPENKQEIPGPFRFHILVRFRPQFSTPCTRAIELSGAPRPALLRSAGIFHAHLLHQKLGQ
jgi:hypothetical protein